MSRPVGWQSASWLRTTPKNSELSLTSAMYSTLMPVSFSNLSSVGMTVTFLPPRLTFFSSMYSGQLEKCRVFWLADRSLLTHDSAVCLAASVPHAASSAGAPSPRPGEAGSAQEAPGGSPRGLAEQSAELVRRGCGAAASRPFLSLAGRPRRVVDLVRASCTRTRDSVETKQGRNEILRQSRAQTFDAPGPPCDHSSRDQPQLRRRLRRPHGPHRARRRLQGDHRGAAAGRPPLVRRDRQGRRPLRGGGAPARAAARRQRRDAGRRGHRPARARLRPAGDDRHPGQRRSSSRSPTRSRRCDEVDYVVITAGSFDLLVEVVCESDEELLDGAVHQDPHHRERACPPRPSCTSSCASRPTRGVCAEPTGTWRGLSLWHETADDDWVAPARAARRPPRPTS